MDSWPHNRPEVDPSTLLSNDTFMPLKNYTLPHSRETMAWTGEAAFFANYYPISAAMQGVAGSQAPDCYGTNGVHDPLDVLATHVCTGADSDMQSTEQQQPDPDVQGPLLRKKRGRPRRTKENRNKGEQEKLLGRRREQLRIAQRKFREKRDMEIAGLVARNNQLEATVESLTTSITSLGEALAQSNVLVGDGDLHGRLSETIGECLCLVSNNGEATNTRRVAAVNPQSELSLPIDFFIRPCPVFSVLPLLENDLAEKLKNPVPVSGINYQELIDILDAALVFSAYMKVANPSISLQRVQHYFHLALTIMNRNRLKSYYATLFHSKLTRQPTLFINDNIPFLQVGGAGTHYGDTRPQPLSHTSSHSPTIFKRAEPSVITAAPLQKVPPSWAARLHGTWFDITDLEMFLKAKQVSLHRCQRAHTQSKSACPKGSVSLQQFVQVLLLRTVSLGQSPGFKRQDVEDALQSCVCV
ncbi:hypothetical protein MAJ_06945, partial [Metarhizium majus ARSEF 297]